jgi:hypothetical protein
MKTLQLALIAATYAQRDTDPIDVTLTTSDEHVRQGDAVVLTCEWSLADDFDDYGETSFQLYWKEKVVGADGGVRTESIANYNGASGETIEYVDHTLGDRVSSGVDFDGRSGNLTIDNLQITDDDTEIFCEIHWSRRFEQSSTTINVYVDAALVELDEIDSTMEGRAYDDNGTIVEPEATVVGSCSISGVYPKPDSVMFAVGDEEEEGDEMVVTPNEDGTFDVTAQLVLEPVGKYHSDEVSCFSLAAPGADVQTNNETENFMLEVFYYTTDVVLKIESATEMSDDQYSVIEHQRYTVSCQADGHPAPEITILNHEGKEILNGAEANAVRTDSVQHITCNAENNDANFTLGSPVSDAVELDVFYIEDVDLGADEDADHGESFSKGCNAVGNPPPQISWTKGDSDYVIETTSQLDIPTLGYSDAGEYTCTASNAAGSASDSFNLKVDGPCIVRIDKTNVDAGQSQLTDPEHKGDASLRLSCTVEGNNCQTEWESEAENFIAQGEIEVTESDDKTTITNSIFFESFQQFAVPTTFTCKASNAHGEKSDELEIGESFPPACCQAANAAGLGTGAIVGIVIAIPAILIIIGAAVFFCRKRNDDKNECVDEGDDAEPEKEPLQPDHDGEGGNAEDDAV